MPRFVRSFIIGMSKTIDIGNTMRVYQAPLEDNIKKSWRTVGIALEKELCQGINSARRSRRKSEL